MKTVPLEIKMRVLSAVDYAPGVSIKARILVVADQTFENPATGEKYTFTWRTISTWLYRFKKHGVVSMDRKTRSDKYTQRKVKANELAEAIHELLPQVRPNKTGQIPRMVLYTLLQEKGYFHRSQLSQTQFYRLLREHQILDSETSKKLRLSFSMQFANEMWQADTMHGPRIIQPDKSSRKTFLIAFIDDASRTLCHGQFFYNDNTQNMVDAFRTALFKRGKPERLYFDNGSNYKSKEILQACVRMDIHLVHAPVRDGAAKGKIERFFRRFRDQFLTRNFEFDSLDQLNELTHRWIEDEYNSKPHSGIQMKPVDRFNLDISRIKYITNNEITQEVFFVEELRKVNKTNCISMFSQQFECPVDLRGLQVQVRYDRQDKSKIIVYFKNKRMGQALALNAIANAHQMRFTPKT